MCDLVLFNNFYVSTINTYYESFVNTKIITFIFSYIRKFRNSSYLKSRIITMMIR